MPKKKKMPMKYFPPISRKKQIMILRAFASFDMTAVRASEFAGISRNTANIYYNHFRERIADYSRRAPRFSGEVEMDQAFFGKGVKRRNLDRRVVANPEGYGAPPVLRDGLWRIAPRKARLSRDNKIQVFGILRRGGDVYTHIIKSADRETLFHIIHLVVEPGTTVYTDKWTAFADLKIDGYTHKPVNHEIQVAGLDGEHTGNIDYFWGFTKHHLSNFRGISRRTFPLHLRECEMRYNMRDPKDKQKFFKFMKRTVFPPKRKLH